MIRRPCASRSLIFGSSSAWVRRDEKHPLWPLDLRGEDDQSSLFPDGRSDDRFVEVVESGEPWRDIC
jgi:hypothetical protein